MNKQNQYLKTKKTGCDYCGEAKPVIGYKTGKVNNWQKVYLCVDCWEIVKEENQKMVRG